ncbi:MAG: autotransporter-associated beta strand repeat-containing protein, partial [Kiritimatiellaeota bacterium]|nr:autotransporter-associated beta strand repeat-containing protein [Kiritimatiellota bacterium]
LPSTKIYKNVAGGLSVVNFNGGTWCLSAGGTVLGAGSFGTTGAVDAAYIYGGGAIIDTTTNNVTITQPLLAPGGSGVVINASSLSLSNYIGAPYVAISSGGGTGATAIAQFDYNSGSVTGIVVTSPGLGYTSTPTVTLIGGGNTNYDLTGVTVLGANTGGGLTKLGNGMLTLSGANTYSGGTIISTGILSIVTTSALPGWDSNGGYAVSSNAALAVGNAVTDDNITTILATTNFAAGAGLAFDTAAGDRSYAAIIGDTVNGALGVVKVGTNALTLSGANTYGSGTIINGGLLNINADAALGAIPGAAVTNITFSGSSTLQFANTFDLATNRNVLINSGVTATFDVQGYTNAIPGLISGAGNLTKTGTGTLVLSGANTYSGTNQIRGGTVQLGANNALSTNALIFGDTTGNTGNLNLGAFDQSIGALTVNSASSNVNTITISTGHTLTIGGNVVIGPTTPPATSPSLLTHSHWRLVPSRREHLGWRLFCTRSYRLKQRDHQR